MAKTIPLISDDPETQKNLWDWLASVYADPRQVNFRQKLQEDPEELEKLFTVHPELRDFKEPETEGSLIAIVAIAFEPGKMHKENVDDWLERKLFTPLEKNVLEFRIDSFQFSEILPRPHYRLGDVFDNPISSKELLDD